MTPTERAEEIVKEYANNMFGSAGQAYAWLLNAIAAALTEARAEGFRECQTKAAKIADGRKFYDPEGWLAQEIRALVPEEK